MRHNTHVVVRGQHPGLTSPLPLGALKLNSAYQSCPEPFHQPSKKTFNKGNSKTQPYDQRANEVS